MASFEFKGAAEFKRKLKQMSRDAAPTMAPPLYEQAQDLMRQSQALLPDGELRNSASIQTSQTPGGAQVSVTYDSDHAVYVHEGTGPAAGKPAYRPPPDAIREWVQRNLAVPANDLDRTVYAIQEHIVLTGTEPVKYLERPLIAGQRRMHNRLADAAKRFLESQGR